MIVHFCAISALFGLQLGGNFLWLRYFTHSLQYFTAPSALFDIDLNKPLKKFTHFIGTVSLWCLFGYCRSYIDKYKTWSTFCSDWPFFVVNFADNVRDPYAKKLLKNYSRRELSKPFSGGVIMSVLKDKRVGASLQQKWRSENRWREVECVDKSEIVPNWHVFVSIVGR